MYHTYDTDTNRESRRFSGSSPPPFGALQVDALQLHVIMYEVEHECFLIHDSSNWT